MVAPCAPRSLPAPESERSKRESIQPIKALTYIGMLLSACGIDEELRCSVEADDVLSVWRDSNCVVAIAKR